MTHPRLRKLALWLLAAVIVIPCLILANGGFQ